MVCNGINYFDGVAEAVAHVSGADERVQIAEADNCGLIADFHLFRVLRQSEGAVVLLIFAFLQSEGK